MSEMPLWILEPGRCKGSAGSYGKFCRVLSGIQGLPFENNERKMLRFNYCDKEEKQRSAIGSYNEILGSDSMLNSRDCSRNMRKWQSSVLDLGGNTMLTWNRVFVIACVASHFIDPLFFFLPTIDGIYPQFCIRMDHHLAIVLTCLRSLIDIFFIFHIATGFCTAYVDPVSRVFGKGELVIDPKKIAKRYIRKKLIIDILAALPVPQVLVWAIIPSMKFRHISAHFFLVILAQSAIRVYITILISIKIMRTVGFFAKNGWEGVIYNLILYLVASHVVGAIFYLLAVCRQKSCWETECYTENMTGNKIPCDISFLDCNYATSSGTQNWANNTKVFLNCNFDISNVTVNINYGIFMQAVQNRVATIPFSGKYFYSLWWGLQQLTTYGNPLVTSSFIGENLFAIGLTILSICLFALLVGNMQTYVTSQSTNIEDWRMCQIEMDDWVTDHQLPNELCTRIRKFFEHKWIATNGVEDDMILRQLPADLRRDIKKYLCLEFVQQIPFFGAMDQQVHDAICERMSYFFHTKGTYILREGDPVKVMLFVIRGNLESSTTDGGRTDLYNSTILKPGDFCGEELLTWALLPSSGDSYPSSTRTVRTMDELEAFSLGADDLKFVARTYKMMHSKHLKRTFRFYSCQWRTWAARFIQSAWRRHGSRKHTLEVGLSTRWESFFSLLNETTRLEDFAGSSSSSLVTASQGEILPISKIASIFRKAQKERPEEPDYIEDGPSE